MPRAPATAPKAEKVPDWLSQLPDWPDLMPIKVLRWAVGGVSETTIRKYVDEGRFPQPVTVMGRKMWKRDEIIEWVAGLGTDSVQSSRPPRLGEKVDDRAR